MMTVYLRVNHSAFQNCGSPVKDDDGVFEGEPQRLPELRVAGEDTHVIGRAHPFAAAQQRRVGERGVDQLAERIEHEHRHEQQRRRHIGEAEQISPTQVHGAPRKAAVANDVTVECVIV